MCQELATSLPVAHIGWWVMIASSLLSPFLHSTSEKKREREGEGWLDGSPISSSSTSLSLLSLF